jgi:hypothetical protein
LDQAQRGRLCQYQPPDRRADAGKGHDLLEELLARGYAGAEYDAWLIKIGDGDQYDSGLSR